MSQFICILHFVYLFVFMIRLLVKTVWLSLHKNENTVLIFCIFIAHFSSLLGWFLSLLLTQYNIMHTIVHIIAHLMVIKAVAFAFFWIKIVVLCIEFFFCCIILYTFFKRKKFFNQRRRNFYVFWFFYQYWFINTNLQKHAYYGTIFVFSWFKIVLLQ